MTDPETSEQAFRRFQDHGDAAALADVFDRTAPQLLLLAAHVTPDAAAAEDLLQDSFLQAMERAHQWDPARPLLPWLGGILRHRAQDLARRLRLRRPSAPLQEMAAVARGPRDEAEAGELLERVRAALDAMDSPYREALVLRLVHGLQPTEIAHALGRPPSTVRVQLKRGLSVLRGALPASLAGALAMLLLPGQGLAATRQAVLGAAGGAAGGGAVAASKLGARAARGWWLAAAGVLLCSAAGAYLLFGAGSPGEPARPPAAVPGDERSGVVAADAVSDPLSRSPAAERGDGATERGAASPRTVLRGRCVRGTDGTPVAGARVVASFSRGRFVTDDPEFRRWPEPIAVRSGGDGTFAIAVTPQREMRVTLTADASGCAETSASWPSLRSGLDAELGDIALWPGCLLQARVVDENGAPVPGVVLEIERRSSGIDDGQSPFSTWNALEVESGADGAVPEQVLPAPGSYGVEVSFLHAGYRVVAPTEIEVGTQAALAPEIVVARPDPAQSMAGRVVDERGNPVAGVTLAFEPQMPDLGSATTGADGTFWFPELQLPQAELELYLPARERRYRLLEPGRKYPRGARDLEVRVQRQPSFDVPIEVVDGRSGRPVTRYGLRWEIDYWVDELALLVPPDRIYRPSPPDDHPAGRALLQDLLPGRYRLCVHPADDALAPQYLVPLQVTATGAAPVRVALQGFAPLSVRVRNEAGEPVVGARVRLVHAMESGVRYAALFSTEQLARGVGGGRSMAVLLQTETTGADGEVRLRAPVDEARLGLQIDGPRVGFRREPLGTVAAAGRAVEVTVPALAEVRGRVGPPELLARIGPPTDARRSAAMVRPEDSDLTNYCPVVELQGDGDAYGGRAPLLPDGTFVIDSARPGDYRLQITLDWEMNPGFYTVETLTLVDVHGLQAGEVRELEIDAARHLPSQLQGTVLVDGVPWTRGPFGLLTSDPEDDRFFHIELGPDGGFDHVLPPESFLPYATWEDDAGTHYLFGSQRRNLAPGASETLRFAIERRVLRVALRRPDGRPAMAGASLRWRAVDFPEVHRWYSTWCEVSADGVVAFDPAPPGRIQLSTEAGALLGEAVASQPVTEVRLQLR